MALRRTNLAVEVPNNLNRLFRRRLSYRNELLAQMRLRANLELTLYSRLESLIRQHIRRQADLLSSSNYLPQRAELEFTEKLITVLTSHFKRVFLAIYERNSNVYQNLTRKDDAFDFSNVNFEIMVGGYISTNRLKLSGISSALSKRIQNIIETGYRDGMTLAEIARDVRDNAPIISRIRATMPHRGQITNIMSMYQKT